MTLLPMRVAIPRGLAGEFYFDDWAFRFAQIAGPKDLTIYPKI
jgi:hypothetical protein